MGIKAVWKCHHRVVILSPRNLSEILCNPVREVLQFFPCPGNAGGSVQPAAPRPAQPLSGGAQQWAAAPARPLRGAGGERQHSPGENAASTVGTSLMRGGGGRGLRVQQQPAEPEEERERRQWSLEPRAPTGQGWRWLPWGWEVCAGALRALLLPRPSCLLRVMGRIRPPLCQWTVGVWGQPESVAARDALPEGVRWW